MKKKDNSVQLGLFATLNSDQPGEEYVLVRKETGKRITVRSINQDTAFLKKKLREEQRIKDVRGSFVWGKSSEIKKLEESNITLADRRYFMQLVLYAEFNEKPLCKNGIPLTAKTIAEDWGIGYKKASERLVKFIELGLLKKIKNGRENNYILNKDIFFKGSGIKNNEKFVKLFQSKLLEVIENIKEIEKAINKKSRRNEILDVVGLLHAVMPYFHYETYYLVKNPDDKITLDNESVEDALLRDSKQLKHLSKSQISKILGFKKGNRSTVDKYMDYLQQAGAVMIIKHKNRTRYLIHPDLMFRLDTRGLDSYTKAVRTLFGQHD